MKHKNSFCNIYLYINCDVGFIFGYRDIQGKFSGNTDY